MGHSSLVGTDKVSRRPKGTGEDALGPSDSTDSGSDTLGGGALPTADTGEPVDVTLGRDQPVAPLEGTTADGDDADAAPDIGTDRIIDTAGGEDAPPDAEDSVDGLPAPRRTRR